MPINTVIFYYTHPWDLERLEASITALLNRSPVVNPGTTYYRVWDRQNVFGADARISVLNGAVLVSSFYYDGHSCDDILNVIRSWRDHGQT